MTIKLSARKTQAILKGESAFIETLVKSGSGMTKNILREKCNFVKVYGGKFCEIK